MTTIKWECTSLGLWYPTIDGRDVFNELRLRHGKRIDDAPIFDDPRDAQQWATEHGYNSEFGTGSPRRKRGEPCE